MLLGRNDERLALDDLLAQARAGRSGVLALVGEPGIGKTALLEHAGESAEGMRVLRARGIESEAVIPFAGLAELLRPALSALDRIPEPQAAALAGATASRSTASAAAATRLPAKKRGFWRPNSRHHLAHRRIALSSIRPQRARDRGVKH